MRSNLLVAAAVLCAVVGAVSAQAAPSLKSNIGTALPALNVKQMQDVVAPFREWVVSPNTPGLIYTKSSWNIRTDRTYSLKGVVPRKFLQYERQSFGINLGWTDNASAATEQKSRRFFFARRGSGDGPIVYGEKLAIGLGKSPSFLRYKARDFGINLDWSSSAVYEWVFIGGPAGTPVRAGDKVVIFNLTHQEPLMYFDRTVGGDIGWPDSQTWTEAAKSWVKDEGLEYLKKAAVDALKDSVGL